MYKKKRWICVAWLLVMMLLLCACGNLETGKNQGEVAENDKIQIGMSFDSFVIERWQRDRDIFVSTAKELGAEVNVQNANGDLEQQKKQINYFIDKGMDVIVVICIDSKGLTEEVQRAKDAGIKIIAYDRLLQNTDIDLYISFDNERVGTMMGEALLENGLAGGNVLMLGGSAVDSNVAMVEKGFRKVMEDNQVTILDSMHADGWKAELAGAYIYDHMDVVSEADAIMCGNDDLASKVVHALKEKRLAGDIMVVGQDADLEACQRIVEGTQVMTVYKPVEKMSQKAAERAVLLAKGEPLPEGDTVTIENGKYEVPYIGLEPISVDKNNMNDVIIGSGFHLKEDVYLKQFQELDPQDAEDIEKVIKGSGQTIRKRPYADTWVKYLKSKGYHVYILSNYSSYMLDHTKKELTFRREMDGEVFSCYAKQLKPDAEIYQIILNKYQLKPEECVFIDDRPENCRGAQEQGIHTICFKDFKQVTADLEKLGVK